MQRLRIEGPCLLSGKLAAGGTKNAALPALAASLLADRPLLLENLPAVQDIRTMVQVLAHLGVESRAEGENLRLLPDHQGNPGDAPPELVKAMRASILILGPLLAKRGHARVSLPGGCAIGARPIDQHLAGLEALGAKVEIEQGYVSAKARRLTGAPFRFAMPTVTGTENLLMAACLARGITVLENCAREPEIVDLARLLTSMGARIDGAGNATITIEGVDSLGGCTHRIIADRIQVGTYLIAGAITGGAVTIDGCQPADLAPLLEQLSENGVQIQCGPNSIGVSRDGPLKASNMATAPHPGFPTDLQAQYMALMTQAEGSASILETVFEKRFQHVPELKRMGANIRIESNTARVHGPCRLSGATVMATDLRASAGLVLAALVARGETMVEHIHHLDRGYENMESNLQALGARIERIPG